MRILLVNPPRSESNQIREHAPPEALRFVHKKLVGPPLGLVTLSAALPDDDATVLDLKGELDLASSGASPGPAPDPAAVLREWMGRLRPDIVGCTFIASEHPAGMALLRAAKAAAPEILTVAGGLHATLCPQDFDDPAVDVLCPGDAVVVFRELVRAREAGAELASVGGVLLRTPAGLRPSPAPATPCDPVGRDFVFPDRGQLDRWRATYQMAGNTIPHTYLYSSLGCTSRCSFCSIWPAHRGAYHLRDVESVITELGTIDEAIVRFADANTLVDLAWTDRLADRLIEADLGQTYVMDLRMDTAAAHPRLIEKLARAGLRVVITGVESPRPEELRRYGKRLELGQIREGLRVCHQNGLGLRANYVVPPDYDLDDFRRLAEFAAAHPAAYAGYTILTPMPGTILHRQMAARVVDPDLGKYNFFNCVLDTRLGRDRFLEEVGRLWAIRLGDHVLS